jgi:hypothetical protein
VRNEQRYHVTIAFWDWCEAHAVSLPDLARVTGYHRTLVNGVRLHPRHTVSQRFVDCVCAEYQLPDDRLCFLPVPSPITVRRKFLVARSGDPVTDRNLQSARSA